MPWLTFRAIDKLQKIVRRGTKIFEYGSGGSTLFFAKKGASITSVEHDASWAERLKKKIAERGYSNVNVFIIKPTKITDILSSRDEVADCLSRSPMYSNVCFFDYVNKIAEFPDGYFDLILIDGRARPSCLIRAFEKSAIGGWIFLDNTERDYYNYHMSSTSGRFERIDYFGPTPYIPGFTVTSAFRRIS